jgi:hypothetical protein
MKDSDREFLSAVCGRLERRFPGVTAAFEGFLTPYLGNDRDGFLVVEVFNVPEDRMEDVLREGEAPAFEHLMKGGGFVTFSLWNAEDTQEYFSGDLRALEQAPERLAAWLSAARLARPWHPPAGSVAAAVKECTAPRQASANTELAYAA